MRLMIIEDDAELRGGLHNLLAQKGNVVDALASGRDGLNVLLSEEYDLAIIDLSLPELDGLSVIRALRKQQRGVP
jgi:two-component system OmpR family response regulator